ncbi:MAG: ADP-ribosylglycohydrolase family protein [Chloroflexi bacterium]|nr:ADP-ribosylglycohydrolase family protein [Chloroflexota bacterium]
MTPGRLPAGSFTDDTEMALALAESLPARCPFDPADLAQRFVSWLQGHPPDVGLHTRDVLARIAAGAPWDQAAAAVQRQKPDAAGNGSVMRCWPAALAHWDDLESLLIDSQLQSRVTHPHVECVAGSAWVNAVIYHLLRGDAPADAVARALDDAAVPAPLRAAIETAPSRSRDELVLRQWLGAPHPGERGLGLAHH